MLSKFSSDQQSQLEMKRVENSTSRQQIYSKRKGGIVKKANELSVLCDTDVALLMFSPAGQLTSFSSSGSVEDVLLRYANQPDELKGRSVSNEENLSQRLKQLKYEGEMVEKMAIIEGLEEKLDKLARKRNVAQEKIRYYEVQTENINSVLEAGAYQQFLMNALDRIQLSKAKMLSGEELPQRIGNDEGTSASAYDTAAAVHGSGYANPNWNSAGDESGENQTGPHLSLSFVEAQKFKNA